MTTYRRVAQLKTADDFRTHLATLGISIPFDEELRHGPESPLAQPCVVDGGTIGNRFAVLPMEGWDGTRDGRPTELTRRRWQRFGASGAKLIWGGEAVAVRADGRANPNQLLLNDDTRADIAGLRERLIAEHHRCFGRTEDLLVGLQLTHSGRFARPRDKGRLEPILVYHHPLLDRKFGVPADQPVLSDNDVSQLVDDFVRASKLSQQAGFAFVDIKHCHGYLGHEFLQRRRSARPLWRQLRQPYTVPARDRGRYPRRGVRTGRRRPRQRRGLAALPRGSGWSRRAGDAVRRILPLCFRRRRHWHGHRPDRAVCLPRSARRARHPLGVHLGRQSLLQPTLPATGADSRRRTAICRRKTHLSASPGTSPSQPS